MPDTTGLRPIESEMLTAATKETAVRHGFFTREGGVSSGFYAGLNVGMGSDDDAGDVEENRRRVGAWFGVGADRLVTSFQVHSPHAVVAREPFKGEKPRADAVVTDTPGLVVGIVTADCAPILFTDAEAGIVAAAHAGWRGALGGIVEATVEAMEGLGADRERIAGCIGPAIGPDAYEVGSDFRERFADADPEFEAFFSPARDEAHAMFDLPGFLAHRLAEAGVRADTVDRCTYADEARFYSYRRMTHRGEPDYGRQISAIGIMED
ncbi:peptidoglycan editing factor PgeF [Pararhizobium mangrovi]|uniref:Purine nucleoside phosphorylase n=1 Tax=Pararhizobium mangrovi TaxID=2590452 RepID=A0A506UBL5_9HYPH|nr:peptidoglycan editing factor PgeF [Pararhizobium mangrovi]TPW30394.1 peptidoglycan editing factor PgeF [Pararhizobium mangrovi]